MQSGLGSDVDVESWEMEGYLKKYLDIDQNGVITGSIDLENMDIPYSISYPYLCPDDSGHNCKFTLTYYMSGFVKVTSIDGRFKYLGFNISIYDIDD